MVEELEAKADPEHQTLQNFRTSRNTNDARMLQFFRLSGCVCAVAMCTSMGLWVV